MDEPFDRGSVTVLVLDDDTAARSQCAELFERAGFAAVFSNPFTDADLDAFFGLVAHEIHLVVASPRSDGTTAHEAIGRLQEQYHGPILVVSDNNTADWSQEAGVYDCVPRDVSLTELLLLKAEKALVESHFVGALERNTGRAQKLFVNILAVLVRILESKDPYTRNHSHNVCKYARMLGRRCALSEAELDRLGLAAMLHDFGKIGIVEAILNKPGGLTDEEYEVMKQHPSIGGTLIQSLPNVADLVPAIVHHHERWDGGGYPDGLRGENSHLWARIVAIADAYDTMASRRTYKDPKTFEECVSELRENAGSQFDPQLVEMFIEVLDKSRVMAG